MYILFHTLIFYYYYVPIHIHTFSYTPVHISRSKARDIWMAAVYIYMFISICHVRVYIPTLIRMYFHAQIGGA